MAQQIITTGNVAGDGTGDPLRDAFTKINENFTELYSGNVQVTAANVLVYSVAGRTGNIVLTVNDVAQAASKSYVNTAIASNLANVTGSITNSLNANITAANAVISNHAARITTLESNAATQATAITNLTNTRATIAYVDTSIGLALSGNAILANVAAVNANVSAANAAILLRANLTGANFSGNITANYISASNVIRTDSYFVGGIEANQGLGQQWANPAALFFSNSAISPGPGGNRYYQINLQNLDPLGSGDIVVTADDGTDASNYIGFGIAGSQYQYFPFYPSQFAHDGYLYITGGNLDIQSNDGNIEFIAGNLVTGQVILTQSNILKLTANTVIQFSDGTIQSTAFGGNTNVAAINANITAANAAITALQANAASQALDINSLISNAAGQGSSINTLTTNAASQAAALNSINANVGAYQTFANSNAASQTTSINLINANITASNVNITSLLANASTQALELNNLQSNAQSQQGNIIALQSNSATQAVQIDLLNSNLIAANTNIAGLTSNAATQGLQISLINANLIAANLNITTLQSNAASQAADINTLYANINSYLANVATSNANIAAANARIIVIDANLGSTSTNVSVLQSNVATHTNQINIINELIDLGNVLLANVANVQADTVFNGNVGANYFIANANVKIGSTLEVGIARPINYPGLGGVFVGDVDSYYQVVVQNLNPGANASGDITITADDGTESTKYLNIGINSSGWSGNFIVPAGDTGLQEFPHDGYITVIGGNAALRSDNSVFFAANTSVVGLLQDSNFLLFNCNLQFSDGTIQRSAITDVPALYANIGTLSLFQSNIVGNAAYTPNNAANYNGTVTNVQEALDQLAARLRALGG
jgi:hypothetical protein